jgi:TPR repeat protein
MMQQRLLSKLPIGRRFFSSSVWLLLLITIFLGSSFFSSLMAGTSPRWLLEFEEKCDAGSMKDCMNAAHSHAVGTFVLNKTEINKERAEFYTQRVIQMGHQGCNDNSNLGNCYLLGLMYFEGRVVNRDVPKGMEIINNACSGGHEEACQWLKDVGVMPRR